MFRSTIVMTVALVVVLAVFAPRLSAKVEEMPNGSCLSAEMNKIYPSYSSLSPADQRRAWHVVAALNNAMKKKDQGGQADLTEISNVHLVIANNNYYYPGFGDLQSMVQTLKDFGITDLDKFDEFDSDVQDQVKNMFNSKADQDIDTYRSEMENAANGGGDDDDDDDSAPSTNGNGSGEGVDVSNGFLDQPVQQEVKRPDNSVKEGDVDLKKELDENLPDTRRTNNIPGMGEITSVADENFSWTDFFSKLGEAFSWW